jgi:hypothetical protein
MTQVLVGDLVCQHTTQLIVIGSPQQTHGDIKFAIPGVRGVNFLLIDYSNLDLIWTAGMIHGLQKRWHNLLEPLRVTWIDAS